MPAGAPRKFEATEEIHNVNVQVSYLTHLWLGETAFIKGIGRADLFRLIIADFLQSDPDAQIAKPVAELAMRQQAELEQARAEIAQTSMS